MRLWILSDLHLEYADLREPLQPPDADVCVMAGDLCRGIDNGIRWLAQHIAPAMPCIYVAGNHEFYKGSIKEGLEVGRAAAKEATGIHFLENDAVNIDGVRFLGATLWTDFRIEGAPEAAMCQSARKVDPGSASNIDPLCRAQTGSARPGEAGRGCAARSGADDWPFRL